jgi:galactose mutarotase-like enzyme
MIKEGTFKGLNSIILENEYIKATFLPMYGSKLASFYDKKANWEWLFQAKDDVLSLPSYGAPFSHYDSSGFDEVFPTIDACVDPVSGKPIPDHGEVWALPWSHKIEGETIIFSVKSPVLPYTLTKRVWMEKKRLCFAYEAMNHSDEPFYFIWTPHALLRCNEFTKIIVPRHLTKVMTVEHSTEHLGEWGTIHNYPITISQKTGKPLDLSKMEPACANNCEKFYFIERIKEGTCGIMQEDIKRSLTYHYPVDKIPYLGIWKTQGGYRGDYNLAMEPCTGVYDNLYVAHAIRKVASIQPHCSFTWWFHMEIGGTE